MLGFELKLGNRAGTMSLCIPFTVIEPLIEDIAAQSWFQAGRHRTDDHWSRLVGQCIAEASLEVAAVMAETSITMADLRSLEIGDLLTTDKPAEAPVTVTVEGIPKFVARSGQSRGNRAVRILERIQSGQ